MATFKIAHERSFDVLLLDSIALLLHALEAEPDDGLVDASIRACILNSLLLTECAANTCIDALNLERGLHNETDKLSALSKFDLYLRFRHGRRVLDRGSVHVQRLQEMKRLRDGVVHLKSNLVEWEQHGAGSESASPSRLGASKVATNIKFWGSTDAINVMQAVHGFFRYFFVDLCGYSKPTVAALLFSEEKVPNGSKDYGRPSLNRDVRVTLSQHGISLDYIWLAWA
jgi:hypothetical protein